MSTATISTDGTYITVTGYVHRQKDGSIVLTTSTMFPEKVTFVADDNDDDDTGVLQFKGIVYGTDESSLHSTVRNRLKTAAESLNLTAADYQLHEVPLVHNGKELERGSTRNNWPIVFAKKGAFEALGLKESTQRDADSDMDDGKSDD